MIYICTHSAIEEEHIVLYLIECINVDYLTILIYQALRQTNITLIENNMVNYIYVDVTLRPTLPNKSYIKENSQFTRDDIHFLTSKKKDSASHRQSEDSIFKDSIFYYKG